MDEQSSRASSDGQIESLINNSFVIFEKTNSNKWDELAKDFTEPIIPSKNTTALNKLIKSFDLSIGAKSPEYAQQAEHLALLLFLRFNWAGDREDLNRAIEVADAAVMATAPGSLGEPERLTLLGSFLGGRFEKTVDIADINRAIEVTDAALKATHPGSSGEPERLTLLGYFLGCRFEQTVDIADINRAIEVSEIAVEVTSSDEPDRAVRLSFLGTWLRRRFERYDDMSDINRAVEACNTAVNSTSPNDFNRARILSSLGVSLRKRFERTGNMDDMNQAVQVGRTAVETATINNPLLAEVLNNFGTALGRKFERTGDLDDLNQAVDAISEAVQTSYGHSDQHRWLSNYGSFLGRRFERTGNRDDLNQAIKATDMATKEMSSQHLGWPAVLLNYGALLTKRSRLTGDISDINEAVRVADMAVEAVPSKSPLQPDSVNNLGVSLSDRYRHTKDMSDLNRAIDAAEKTIQAINLNHPSRTVLLGNLGSWLAIRYEQTYSLKDLESAIKVADQAVKAISQDHPNRATYLITLGELLFWRSLHTGSIDDRKQALASYKEGWSCRTAPPSVRIQSARNAAAILASMAESETGGIREEYWTESSRLLQDAVKILPTVSPRTLRQVDGQRILTDFAGLASTAAAVTLNGGHPAHHALEILEIGRCIMAGLLLETRTDLTELNEQHPVLAKKFEILRDELDLPEARDAISALDDRAGVTESRVRRRREADRQFHETIKEIRDLSGFQNFLRPPTEQELMAQAAPGPIILINTSRYRCDAFLVEQNRIQVLQLPELRLEEVEKRAKILTSDLKTILAWLWRVVAEPCLEKLGFVQSNYGGVLPRVWWIPTGLLSHFPLHAAGRHSEGSSKTVLDRVVSSYSSSIKALMYSRQRRVHKESESRSERVLLVGMNKTPGQSDLHFVEQEVEDVEEICQRLALDPVKLSRNCREEVLQNIQICKILHFAGHGQSESDPSRSSLLLEDWKTNPLTVADLRNIWCSKNAPFLAYLSACSTSANLGGGLVDEAIHLVNACQLAGFRHVIGTLWPADDECTYHVARGVYEAIGGDLWEDDIVAFGLHNAVINLRDKTSGVLRGTNSNDVVYMEERLEGTGKNPDCERENYRGPQGYFIREGGDPAIWASYIHVGP